MRLSKSQTALLNTRELRLLTAKGPWQVSELATVIRQVRDLRDKQRDLLQRQGGRLAAAGKGRVGATGVANERTAAKERLLDAGLQALQQALRDIDQESTQACHELLDDDDDVPGRRANPKKAAKRVKAAAPASGAAKKTRPAGTDKAAKKTAPKGRKTAGKVVKKPAAKRASAKAPAPQRSSKARVAIPKHVGGDASARPSLASRKSRGTRSR